jgi:uncharacterized membrane protein YciS (DUF1049 family)
MTYREAETGPSIALRAIGLFASKILDNNLLAVLAVLVVATVLAALRNVRLHHHDLIPENTYPAIVAHHATAFLAAGIHIGMVIAALFCSQLELIRFNEHIKGTTYAIAKPNLQVAARASRRGNFRYRKLGLGLGLWVITTLNNLLASTAVLVIAAELSAISILAHRATTLLAARIHVRMVVAPAVAQTDRQMALGTIRRGLVGRHLLAPIHARSSIARRDRSGERRLRGRMGKAQHGQDREQGQGLHLLHSGECSRCGKFVGNRGCGRGREGEEKW